MQTIKERFFDDHLVPTGQVLEIILGLHHSQFDRKALAYAAFDTLNLVSCYVIHPHTTVLDDVQAAVGALTQELLKVIETLGTARGNHVSEVLLRKYAQTMRTQYAVKLAQVVDDLPQLRQAIHSVIGYDPAKRAEWIHTYTSTTSSLTAGGRTNRWRTFVRNLSWSRAADLMGVRERLENPGRVLIQNAFNCIPGQERATALWEQVFSETVAVQAPASGEEPARTLVPVPNGVQIAVTPDKLLSVSMAFNPAALLGPDRNQQMATRQKQGQALSPELTKALAPRGFQDKTDLVGLADVVAKAEVWMVQQRQDEAILCQLYDQWLTAMRLDDVRKKLGKHFKADEYQLLLQALAEGNATPA